MATTDEPTNEQTGEPTSDPTSEPTSERLAETLKVLECIAADRGLLERMPVAERHRLLRAVNLIALPDKAARKQLSRAFRRREREEAARRKAADEVIVARAGIRQYKKACAPAPFLIESSSEAPDESTQTQDDAPRLQVARSCYICKQDFDRLHHFYDSMCPECAALNWSKRSQTADLRGRWALLTGGRVKIGFEAALKLLRAGASVVVTTRFPHDAAERFAGEQDSADWHDRLHLFGLDLRHTPSVEAFADHLCETLPHLDFILNNACQTVRRPPGFYAHLMDGERRLSGNLTVADSWLQSWRTLQEAAQADQSRLSDQRLASDSTTEPERELPAQVSSSLAGIHRAAELSQIPLVPDDALTGPEIFPEGQLDRDAQQVDLRAVNSWRLRLADVPTVELLEVQLVNAVAPFILNARLKPLMQRTPGRDKHIVNVSAMEGVFYRAYKTDKHPHTNMAKAALNMLTRTSAQDYARDGIHMNSVDTGWITDEDPARIAQRKADELGFHPPLDLIDAAARICDPIFVGLLTGRHEWGNFYKDYQIANW